MPPALAISAMTTVGYAGILAGPAAMGFVSKAVGLQRLLDAGGIALPRAAGRTVRCG